MEKRILLGITGGIAAYKMVEVASSLTKMGYSVNVVMTESATKFITPLTFQNITHNPVETDLFTPPVHYNVKHTSLAESVDLCLIGPATANFIAKLAHGLADDLLSTVLLATEAPILLAPSMNVHMYANPILQDNLSYLEEKGYKIIEPGSGLLACGDKGKGRLPEPQELVENVVKELTNKDLIGKKILVTAGPTREPVDPVRYLSNYSSGKMGYALARSASYRGGEVILISGPTNLKPPLGVNIINVDTALEMEREVKKYASQMDIIIMSAAVADFRPRSRSKEKIKKVARKDFSLELQPNPDILATLGAEKKEGQLLIGFAAESENLLDNALEKLNKKNLDMIIANNINIPGIGFASDFNQVYLISEKLQKKLPRMDKEDLADKIFEHILEL